jgi:hypothetical protein
MAFPVIILICLIMSREIFGLMLSFWQLKSARGASDTSKTWSRQHSILRRHSRRTAVQMCAVIQLSSMVMPISIVCAIFKDVIFWRERYLSYWCPFRYGGVLTRTDDNVSGVAGVFEMAKLAAAVSPHGEVRGVLSRGTASVWIVGRMGSMVSARALHGSGVRFRGIIALEMISYYDERSGTQFYLIHGALIVFVGNLASRRFTKDIKRSFMRNSSL